MLLPGIPATLAELAEAIGGYFFCRTAQIQYRGGLFDPEWSDSVDFWRKRLVGYGVQR